MSIEMTEVRKWRKQARPMIVERYEQHKVWEALLAGISIVV